MENQNEKKEERHRCEKCKYRGEYRYPGQEPMFCYMCDRKPEEECRDFVAGN